MLAAELRVKNAVSPLSFKLAKTSGYGLRRATTNTINGLMTNAIKNIVPTKMIIRRPYEVNAVKPVVEICLKNKSHNPNWC